MPTITDRTRKRLSQKQLRNQCRASRRQQARKARASRRQIDRIHDQLPKQVRTIFDPVEPAFTHPTHHRFVLLALTAILTLRGRTIANLLRCLGSLAPGHPRATASKIPVILAVLDGNLVCSYNVYYWHIFNNHPNYGCKSLEYSQNFRSITVSGLPYLMKNPHFDAVALPDLPRDQPREQPSRCPRPRGRTGYEGAS